MSRLRWSCRLQAWWRGGGRERVAGCVLRELLPSFQGDKGVRSIVALEEFFDSEIEKRQNRIAKERGFAIHDHSLQIYADCIKENCPNRKPDGRQRT